MVVGAQAREIDTVVIGSGPGGYVAAIRAAGPAGEAGFRRNVLRQGRLQLPAKRLRAELG